MTTCLIVDDSPTIRKIMHRIMQDLNFECMEAENGQEAYDICMNTMPDLIMLDWNMPVMSGIDFLLRLRAMKDGNVPKVLFCTTENGMDFIQRGLSAGADEYVMKPFDKDVIEMKLQQLGISPEPA